MKKDPFWGLYHNLVPLLHKSWDNWSEFYNEIIKNARIIKESGIADALRVVNGGFITAMDSLNTNPLSEQE